jgi:hypothetical protein
MFELAKAYNNYDYEFDVFLGNLSNVIVLSVNKDVIFFVEVINPSEFLIIIDDN